MIGKVTLGKNDLERAAAFYDELLKNLGASRLWSTERSIAWSVAPDRPAVCVLTPGSTYAITVVLNWDAALRR
jgi:hypothetical protein